MSRVLLSTPALALLAGWGVFLAVWFPYRFLHHSGGDHRGPRPDPKPQPDPEPYPEDAADYTMPGMFLGAPTEVIPVKPVYGTPPWALPQPHEELVPLPEPEPGPPVVADITRGIGATLTDHDPHAAFKTSLLTAVKILDGRGAHRVYLLMGGDT